MRRRRTRTAWAVGSAAVLTQICYPLASGAVRDRVTLAVVLLLTSTSVLHAWTTRGPRWTGGLVAVTALGGFLAEQVGTATGVPFGAYSYAPGRLGPELGGVPLLIALAWTAGAYPAWCAASRVAGGRTGRRFVLAALGLAGWDLYLDPQMVADGLWVWVARDQGLPGVEGVPISNYLGWLGVAAVMSALLSTLGEGDRVRTPPDDRLPILLFGWTWLGSALAHAAFLGLPASAVYGFVGMGLLGVPLVVVCARDHRARPWDVTPPAREAARTGRRRLAPWARAA